jgi:ferrous iron transport protein B
MTGSATSSRDVGDSSITIALVGNPNTGKSSLFNALCGLNARVGNYPGVTVEKKIGSYVDGEGLVQVIDLPGTYSLSARSPDERVSVDVLLGHQSDVPPLSAIVVIVDASNIERNLYLFSQVRELGLPIVLVLNMWDRVTDSGIAIDLPHLEARLGVPLVTTSANRRLGIDQLKQTIRRAIAAPPADPPELFPDSYVAAREALQRSITHRLGSPPPRFLADRLLLDISGQTESFWVQQGLPDLPQQLAQARQELAASSIRLPAIETQVRYGWIRKQLQQVVSRDAQPRTTLSDRIDRWITHRFWGLVAFAGIMFLIFQAIASWAAPLTDGIEAIQESIGASIQNTMPPGPLRSLLIDGVVGGVGSVLVFLPQILILFLFIGLLEDCGYMARAAFVMDKLMTRLGLSGKSFLPLMSSFACAVPGIMATRVIENSRDRLLTILVAPLMSCSARLPVYLLMVSAFVPDSHWLGGWVRLQAVVLLLFQALGALVAIPVAWAIRRWLLPGDPPPFVMELPRYTIPSLRVVAARVWERAVAFVQRAGTLIFATSVLIWAAAYFPATNPKVHQLEAKIEQLESQPKDASEAEVQTLMEEKQRLQADQIRNSFLGRLGQSIEPAIRPLGWDWRIGVGVLASFPAREVIVATLGTIYSLGGDVDSENQPLQATLQQARWPDGRPVYTLPVALSIMVFFALCAQCAATLLVIRRETNSWRWPLFTFLYMTTLAYIGAWLTYQLGTAWLGT